MAYYGDTVVFNCTSKGGPNNKYTWFLYGYLSYSDYRADVIGQSNQLILELNSIDLFAYYQCRVSNEAGNDGYAGYYEVRGKTILIVNNDLPFNRFIVSQYYSS